MIIFVPDDSEHVGRYSPETGYTSGVEYPSPGGFEGGVFDGSRVIFVPTNDDDGVVIYDPQKDTYSTISIPSFSGFSLYEGGGAVDDGRIIFCPDNEIYIGIFDPSDDTFTEGPQHGLDDPAFAGGTAADDGRFIMAPSFGGEVGIFDPSDDSYSSGPSVGDSFNGAVKADDGRIIFPPYSAGYVGIFDPSDDSFTQGDSVPEDSAAYKGGVLLDDGRVCFVPDLAPNIGLYDPSTDTFTQGPSHSVDGNAFCRGAMASNGNVILASTNGNIGIFDPSDNSYTDGPAHGESAFAFSGAVQVGDIPDVTTLQETVGTVESTDSSIVWYMRPFSETVSVDATESPLQRAAVWTINNIKIRELIEEVRSWDTIELVFRVPVETVINHIRGLEDGVGKLQIVPRSTGGFDTIDREGSNEVQMVAPVDRLDVRPVDTWVIEDIGEEVVGKEGDAYDVTIEAIPIKEKAYDNEYSTLSSFPDYTRQSEEWLFEFVAGDVTTRRVSVEVGRQPDQGLQELQLQLAVVPEEVRVIEESLSAQNATKISQVPDGVNFAQDDSPGKRHTVDIVPPTDARDTVSNDRFIVKEWETEWAYSGAYITTLNLVQIGRNLEAGGYGAGYGAGSFVDRGQGLEWLVVAEETVGGVGEEVTDFWYGAVLENVFASTAAFNYHFKFRREILTELLIPNPIEDKYELDQLEGGSGNAYWIEAQFMGDNTGSPELNGVEYDSDANVLRVDQNLNGQDMEVTVYEDIDNDGEGSNVGPAGGLYNNSHTVIISAEEPMPNSQIEVSKPMSAIITPVNKYSSKVTKVASEVTGKVEEIIRDII